MANSPYGNSDSPVYRSRSSSFSTPVSSAFLFQEVVALGGNQLIRSYSCGQVYTKAQSGQTFQSVQIQISNFLTPGNRAKLGDVRKCLSMPKKLALEHHSQTKQAKAKKCLPFEEFVEVKETKKPRKIMKLCIYISIIIIPILLAYWFPYNDCNQEWNIQEVSDKLKQSVFGQDSAVVEIENILKRFHHSRYNTIMSFTGSVGVGKTFVSDIIYNNFPWESSKFVYFYDSNVEKALLDKTSQNCGFKLIIIDGMDMKNVESVTKIVKNLYINNQNMLVILIFKTHDKNEMDFIIKKLDESHLAIHHIVFQDLKIEHVIKCLEAEFERQKKMISHEYLNNVIANYISDGFPGCKKVFHQVSVFPKII